MRLFKKVLSIRESLQSIAVELHRANDVRKRTLHEAMKQTALLESISKERAGMGAMQDFGDRWQPIIDMIMSRQGPPARAEAAMEAMPVELQASGIRTTADPEA